jgi:hypothetical protein
LKPIASGPIICCWREEHEEHGIGRVACEDVGGQLFIYHFKGWSEWWRERNRVSRCFFVFLASVSDYSPRAACAASLPSYPSLRYGDWGVRFGERTKGVRSRPRVSNCKNCDEGCRLRMLLKHSVCSRCCKPKWIKIEREQSPPPRGCGIHHFSFMSRDE